MSRAYVYKAIDSERDYQEAGLGNAKGHPDGKVKTPGEFILIMEECLTKARAAWYKPGGSQDCLDYVRKVTAVGVCCMEIHGAPFRDTVSPNRSDEVEQDFSRREQFRPEGR